MPELSRGNVLAVATETAFSDAPRHVLGWGELKALFPIASDWIDFSSMLITSHPAPVAEAIERYRHALDNNPNVFLQDNNRTLLSEAREAAARYFGGVDAEEIALTESTTMGVALVYNGLRLKPGQEVLTTHQDYYVTHESLRLAADRSGASVRRMKLYHEGELERLTPEVLTDRIAREIRSETRVLALTWIHSSTGLKLPLRRISAALARINAGRDPEDQVLLCVDGVHGFGNQEDSFAELGCDFFMTGCHKWLFGPRGTGIVAATKRGLDFVTPTIPSFFDYGAYGRWIRDEAADTTTGAAFMPGGYKAFEHLWALTDAFALHESIGKTRIARRTAELALQLKEGLAGIRNIVLRTPRSPELSAGLVSFDVEGQRPGKIVESLRKQKIIASVAPYATPHIRFSPSVRNSPQEIDKALVVLRDLAR
jgi:selenocysteine lyase/cysteine desulfurase